MDDKRKTKKELISELKKQRRELKKFKTVQGSGLVKEQTFKDFRDMLWELPEIVYRIDPNGNFTFINKAVRVLGYEPEQLIGKHFSKIVHPDDVQQFSRYYALPKYKGKVTGAQYAPKLFDERRTGKRKTKDMEIRLIANPRKKKSKKVHGIIGIVTAFGDVSSTGYYKNNVSYSAKHFLGSLGVIRDITGRKEAEKALRDSEERYRELVEKADVVILIDDIDGKFKYVNKKFAETFGYELDEIRKLSIEKLVHPEDVPLVMRYHNDRIKGKSVPKHYEFRGIKKDGSIIVLEVQATLIVEDGIIVGSRSYMWDITLRKQVEQKLRTESLHDALTQLHNRRGFTILAQQHMELAKRIGKGFWLIFVDVDDLKSINDHFGHRYGDKVLQGVAKILDASFRTSDITARIGGDEFAVIAIEASKTSGPLLVRRMRVNTERINEESKFKNPFTISIGKVFCEPDRRVMIDELLEQADGLMYKEKRKKSRKS